MSCVGLRSRKQRRAAWGKDLEMRHQDKGFPSFVTGHVRGCVGVWTDKVKLTGSKEETNKTKELFPNLDFLRRSIDANWPGLAKSVCGVPLFVF